ncbi:MAG: DinB family protein [Chitinophagaceae bacterium]
MIENVISRIQKELTETFDNLFIWFERDDKLLNYLPKNGGWSIRKILEHISMTNYFLLILIRKGTDKALRKAKEKGFTKLCEPYEFDWIKMQTIGNHLSFHWNRPIHMEPGGQVPLNDIRKRLQAQLDECLHYLNQMPYGQGTLYKTMMNVNELGKIDVYHYIYFLVQHARRHLTQMEKVRLETQVTS